jgi:hypothetical protein
MRRESSFATCRAVWTLQKAIIQLSVRFVPDCFPSSCGLLNLYEYGKQEGFEHFSPIAVLTRYRLLRCV